MTTNPIIVREAAPGYWTATQAQGRAGLPTTVADGGRSRESVLHSIECRKRVGWIAADTEVIIDAGVRA